MHCAETINGKKGGVLYFCWPSSAFIKKTHKTKKQNENKQTTQNGLSFYFFVQLAEIP